MHRGLCSRLATFGRQLAGYDMLSAQFLRATLTMQNADAAEEQYAAGA